MLANAAKAASKHLPPSWAELVPFFKSSATLWFLILFTGIIRTLFYQYQRSEGFRALVRKVKRHERKLGPIIWLSDKSRQLRDSLVKMRPPESSMAIFVRLPRFASGVVVCVLYVIDTYTRGVPTFFYLFQLFYGIFVSLNFIISFIYADRPLHFAFHITTICECLSIPSLIFASGSVWLNLTFLQAYCILVDWHQLGKHDLVMKNRTPLNRLLVNLCFQFLTFLYVTSCGVQLFETMGDWSQDLKSETFTWTWANAMYFAVVTLMTVGYGDFAPYTFFGRMWIIIHIIVAAFIVTREISLLVDAMQSMRQGNGSYISSPSTNHVVVTGRVKWKFLQPFVIEFLEKTRNLNTKVIVLTSDPNWSDDEWFKFVDSDPFLDYHMLYLEGSPLSMEDLFRADVTTATAVFVLADPHRQDPYTEDSDILKTVLSIRNVRGTVPIYCLNTLAESSFQFGFAMALIETPNGHDQAGFSGTMSGRYLPQGQRTSFVVSPQRQYLTNRKSTSNELSGGLNQSNSPISDHSGRNESNTVLAPEPTGLYSREEEGSSDMQPAEGLESSAMDFTATARTQDLKFYRHSENLCMQELETVLLAENVFCNGLSTLIGNATAQVAHDMKQIDLPWLTEYRLGANCNVQCFTIPPELGGRTYGSVAVILYDFGIIPLAIWSEAESLWVEDGRWNMLQADTILEADRSSMALSYHDQDRTQRFAGWAASEILQKEQERDSEASDGEQEEEGISGDVAGPTHSKETSLHVPHSSDRIFETDYSDSIDPEHEAVESLLVSRSEDIGAWHSTAPSRLPTPRTNLQMYLDSMQQRDIVGQIGAQRTVSATGSRTGQSSVDDISRLNDSSIAKSGSVEGQIENGHDKSAHVKKRPQISRSVSTTATMKAVEESAAKTGGKEDNRSAKSGTEGKPVKREKAIYKPADKLPAALRGHVVICLDGTSCLINLDRLLRQIWRKRARQSKRVPVVVIHPRFPKGFSKRLSGNVDDLFLLQGNSLSEETLRQAQYSSARAVLIMACESDDGKNSSTDSRAIFTVMKLDSLLLEKDTFVCCILDDEESLELLRAPRQSRRVGVNLGEQREAHIFSYDTPTSFPNRSVSVNSLKSQAARSSYVANYGSIGGVINLGGATDQSSNRMQVSAASRIASSRLKTSHSMRFDQFTGSDDQEESDKEKAIGQHKLQRTTREERYERQRYASGELVISSLFIALLAREYTQPGYIKLIRQLIGAFSESEGSWIRQVDIPESWTRGENIINERTYRETYVKLLEMGCIGLGLYRSGNSRVREEYACDVWKRTEKEVVYSDTQERLDEIEDIDLSGPAFEDRPSAFDDPLVYECPTTKRKMYYKEHMFGKNVLPYVFSFPPPYTLVTDSDAVFVLCNPETEIPKNWEG